MGRHKDNDHRTLMKQEYRSLLRLGFPVLITQLGVIIVSFADTMMVGAYGTGELASVAFVNAVFLVPMVLLMGFAGGITPLVGALYSQGKVHQAGRVLRAALQLNVGLAVAIMGILFGLYYCLEIFGQPPELLPLIRRYYFILLWTVIPMALFNCFQQFSNGCTDTAMPMWIILGGNALNITGNYLLIFGHCGLPEMGVAGAALSTLITRCLMAAAIVWLIFARKRFRPYRPGMRDGSELGPIRVNTWKTSYPISLQSGIECFLWTAGAVVCGWFGSIQIASYQIVNTLSQLGFMTFMSFGTAIAIRVSNYNGLRDADAMQRSSRAGLNINLALCTLASLIFILGGAPLIHLFTSDNVVIESALLLLPPLVLYQYADAVQYTYANAQRGTQRVLPLAYISLASYIGVGIPLLYVLAVVFDLGNVGVFYSFSGALLVAALLLFFTFRSTMRRKRAEFAA